MAHLILSEKSACLLSVNEPQVYAILFYFASSKGSGESAHEI